MQPIATPPSADGDSPNTSVATTGVSITPVPRTVG
jgi:hypothetical protein